VSQLLRLATLVVVVVSMVGLALAANWPPINAPTDWKLTFADEFDTLNLLHWDPKFPWGRFLHNGEKEIYVDPTYTGDSSMSLGLNPFSVNDGILTIRADRATPALRQHLQGQLYTSGLLTTKYSFSQLYGYFEMRAKFPLGRGLWPAFWLLPTDQSWPPEIDVVEILGDQPSTLYTTVHMVVGTKNKRDDKIGFGSRVPDVTMNFHTYGVMWSPNYIAWYFDGKRVAYTTTPANVRKPMYILINLAVGGDWPGQPDGNTKFPADMQVDYIRAYALRH
jgi:beta-glucanase (GH16 family)